MQSASPLLRLLLILAAWTMCVPPAPAQGKSDSKVKLRVTAGKIDDKGYLPLTLDLTIDEGWYIYANPTGHKNVDGNETVVTVFGTAKLDDVVVDYPKGSPKKEKYGNDPEFEYRIYNGKVSLQARVKGIAPDAPLEIRVRVFACDGNKCLTEGTVKAKVE